MFFILPNSNDGLQSLLAKLDLVTLKRELFAMEEVEVAVSIPKFKFEFQSRLAQVLQKVPE